MFFLVGGLSILLGIQSEVIMRVYYESQSKPTYLLGKVEQPSKSRADQPDGATPAP
jgi:hypothetical protein